MFEKPKKKRNHPELHEQRKVIEFLTRQQIWGRVLKFTAIPNSTWSPSWAEINRTKASGVNPGLLDVFILLPELNGQPRRQVWMEMKLPKRVLKDGSLGSSPSTVSDEQIEWMQLLNTFANTLAFIAYGANEAIKILTELIGNVSTPKETNEETNKRIADFHSFISREESRRVPQGRS